MKTYYITFGQNHPLRNGWIELEASDTIDAFRLANDIFGNKWSNCYDESNFKHEYYHEGKFGVTIK